ncbi:putative ribonuclease H protein [Vitis vinifera]|uniref:Putative ribonuclease H protein n=1 Tax=Vitis vinifera TaxID=29760 RepID=A0A438IWK0_VITVI|nr:putative ribonuclease H protein [Vitis vinifera]
MLGLRVNWDKSELILVGRMENVEELALEFDCKFSTLLSSYLGLPLGAHFKEVAVWDGVEEKTFDLEKTVYFQRESVSLRLERIQRNFLWGGGALERKPHLVDWCIVCSDKQKGGLGVRNLALLNKALLCKWSWRFTVEKEVLWRQVICGKYGEEVGGWRSCDVRGSNGVGLWKAIRRDWDATIWFILWGMVGEAWVEDVWATLEGE